MGHINCDSDLFISVRVKIRCSYLSEEDLSLYVHALVFVSGKLMEEPALLKCHLFLYILSVFFIVLYIHPWTNLKQF